MKKHIAIDLGASNGRVIVGDLQECTVVHRFVTQNEVILGELHWNLIGLFAEIKLGLKKAFSLYGDKIGSIGIDTWGVDYGLFDSNGSLVSLCYHYRDARTDGLIDIVSERLGGKERVFAETGIAFQPFNTLYQLAAMQRDRNEVFKVAKHYLSVPDLLAYWLTGVMKNERTHASTTQLYNPFTKTWAWDLIDEMQFPRELFGEIVDSGTVLGPLVESVRYELKAGKEVMVIASAAHDTASAVSAVPVVEGEVPLYISSGTWSLLGVELEKPIVSKQALENGFTNEIASNGKVRFLKNIMGMWIQQECVRHWENQGETISWKELDEQTLLCQAYSGFIDPTDNRFLKPNGYGNLMVDRIDTWCEEHDMQKPSSKGEYMVAIYRGLAKAYAISVKQLVEITGLPVTSLYIIGGGCKNTILDQWTATETGLQVYAGPVEATALGNIVVQMLAVGELDSLSAGRKALRVEQKVKCFHP
ncbi:rhamnulokinase family protein [uncultured Sphaerochaeta sp.]|uniref:rhamnulokinase n=1 Tax=uncultured Sphaerochaeta sp. TaxID=886478 RepID=UPI002A0A739E|nr:rhamnulokinase family protein [uncultured Sphaerochaeta sp.]